jgi:glycosyltransferase involved in cell wall biosynthesis
MRIAVDGRHLAAGRGIARYSSRLIGALRTQFPGDELRLAEGGRAAFASAALVGRPRLDRMAGGAAVVWAPAPAPMAVSAGVPFVLTVHDLSWLHRPGDFTAYERLWHRLARIPALAARADRVIVDARATADEVIARWGLAPGKVVVVQPGPGIAEGVTERAAGAVRSPYFLAVGALEPRKAPDLLVRAHRRARASGLRAGLVFAGSGRVAVAGEGVRVLTPDDAGLRELYAGALAVVQPAHLEGFGFPPVEGLAFGAPAIVSDLPVYGETVAGGALRVPAGDERALADALLRLERDPGLRERLVTEGRAAIAGLSWERAARETHAVLAGAVRR